MYHRVIPLADGFDEELADTVQVKHLFRYDETADKTKTAAKTNPPSRAVGIRPPWIGKNPNVTTQVLSVPIVTLSLHRNAGIQDA